jgi:DNA topoisomerase-1
MRTDSVNLSQLAIDAAKSAISKQFGKEYSFPRQYKTKSASAQEAHEAIRPTYLDHPTIDGDSADKRLYELIYKRTIASQMADAQLERTVVTISNNKTSDNFTATGEVIRFDGFLRVYLESTDDETEENESGLLPPLKIGQDLEVDSISATEKYSTPPARYTEASLVKKLEELGIGRPSTYAPTIATVQTRGYVVKEDRMGKERNFNVLTLSKGNIQEEVKTETFGNEKSKMFPTDIGTVVTDFLGQHFPSIMDFNFTANVEKEFDEIAQGNLDWSKMLKKFYDPFHKLVVNTEQNSERANGERVLGKHPESGKQVTARIGRFGPLVQISGEGEDDKPQYAPLRTGQRLETITLEEALDLFKLPRTVGDYEGKAVSVSIGRFGPYVKHDNLFISMPKTDDPYTIILDRAIELIEAKRKAEREKVIKVFKERPDVQLLNGRWGAYLVVGDLNYRIPKTADPKKLTLDDCLEIAADEKNASAKSKFKSRKKTQAAEKVALKAAASKKPAAKKAPAKAVKKTAAKKATPAKKAAKKTTKKK